MPLVEKSRRERFRPASGLNPKQTRVQLYLPIADIPVNIFLILAMGAAVGFVSGMFGIGGGFLMTPLLIFVGIAPAVAVASVASHIAASSFSGALTYWRRRAIDPLLAAVLLTGGSMGTALGVWTFTLLRALGQLDLLIATSYVILLTTVGGLMFWEGLRALLRARRCCRGAPSRQPWLDPRAAAENALQALEDLSVGDSRRRHRPDHRLHRRGDGHRRRLHPGAADDLCAAGADLDRDRPLDGADAGHHGIRHPATRGHQSSGRRRAGFDPDDRRRHRRTVRRAGGPENPWRTSASAARPLGARRRRPLRHRTGDPARRPVHDPGNRRRRMTARTRLTLTGLLL